MNDLGNSFKAKSEVTDNTVSKLTYLYTHNSYRFKQNILLNSNTTILSDKHTHDIGRPLQCMEFTLHTYCDSHHHKLVCIGTIINNCIKMYLDQGLLALLFTGISDYRKRSGVRYIRSQPKFIQISVIWCSNVNSSSHIFRQ